MIKPIEEFSTDALLTELCVRFDHFIFAGRTDRSAEKVERRRYYKGDFDICMGLMMAPAFKSLEDNWGISEGNIMYPQTGEENT